MQPEPVARHWSARWPGGLLLVLLCAFAYLPGLRHLPPVDRDESRFAQASRQMLGSETLQGWIVPMVGDRPRLNKPPLIYWLQAGSAALLAPGDQPRSPAEARHRLITGDVWVYRIPSVLAAIAASLLTWGLARSMFPRDRFTPFLAGAMLAVSLMVLWDARQARADEVLLAITTAAMWCLWAIRRRSEAAGGSDSERGQPAAVIILLWLLIALGILVKGPITPMVIALTVIAICFAKRCRRPLLLLRPVPGLLMVTLIVAPWVILVGREVGWSHYLSTVLDETLGRSVSSAEGHWGPPGYHLLLLPVMFWPGSLLTAAAIIHHLRAAMPRRDRLREQGTARHHALRERLGNLPDESLFLLAWLIPSWIVFELVTTKLPHYTLPLYPALAILSARAISLAAASTDASRALGVRTRAARVGLLLWTLIGMVIAAGIAPALARVFGLVAPTPLMIAMGAASGIGAALIISALRSALRDRWMLAQFLAIIAAAVASASTFGIVLPRLSALWISSRLSLAISMHDSGGSRPIAAIGYQEDSLIFLTNARAERVRPERLPGWLNANSDGIVILPTTRIEDAERLLPSPLHILGRVTGFNYSNGRWEDLLVAEASSTPAGP